MSTHPVAITPTESNVPWATAQAVCANPKCWGWSVTGRATTVIAIAHDHATEEN